MSQTVHVSYETYQAIEALAREQGTTPEHVVETLVQEHLQREAIARQNAEWAAGLDEQLARAARGDNERYGSLEAFFAALDEGLSDGERGE